MKKVALAALLLTPVITLIDWQALAWTALWYVVWLASPTIGAALFAAGRIRQKPLAAALGVSLCIAGVTGGLLARQLNSMRMDVNEELGDAVVTALGKHREARGTYPEELADLVPEFLDEVPIPTSGALTAAPFWYWPDATGNGFVLGYQATRGIIHVRDANGWAFLPTP